MKRILLLSLFAFFAFNSFAQVKVSLRFAPGIAINRVSEVEDQYQDISTKGIGLRFSAGPEVNFFLSKNYSLATGLWYAARRAGVSVQDLITGQTADEVYNLQYLQIPLTMRLFTNEIAPDMRLYFTMGGTFDTKIAEKPHKVSVESIERFSRFDASVLAGAGVELQMGENTFILLGLSYNRGLLNAQAKSWNKDPFGNDYASSFKYNNDLLALEMALRF